MCFSADLTQDHSSIRAYDPKLRAVFKNRQKTPNLFVKASYKHPLKEYFLEDVIKGEYLCAFLIV